MRYAHALDKDLRDALEATASPERSPENPAKSLIDKGQVDAPKTSALPGCAMPRSG
jgi:hypothetical protein